MFTVLLHFYRAMHYSAKRGLAISCLSVRPSVRLSVTLVACHHIGWNSSKINNSRLVSVGHSLSANPNIMDTGNLGPKWPTPSDLSVGDILSQIAAEWLPIVQWSQWRAYRKQHSPFRMVPSLPPYDLPFPQNGGPICTMIREWPYLCNEWSDTLHVWF